MTNLGNDLYISSYTGASISVYDPFQPYHFGNQPGHNHRDIGGVDDISVPIYLDWATEQGLVSLDTRLWSFGWPTVILIMIRRQKRKRSTPRSVAMRVAPRWPICLNKR